ncbi:MAG: IclR family transcriptional regulator [Desulfuromonadaceae bacterium]
MSERKKTTYNIQVVSSALDVLEQFHGTDGELGFTELCNHLKISKNKVFRLLATLESRYFIEQNKETTGYRLGLKNLQLGHTYLKQTGFLRHAKPVLESLTRRCNETSYVAILKDFQAVYLDSIESNLPVRVVSRVGKRFPIYCTAVGKILAADLDERVLREHFKKTEFVRYTSNTIIDHAELADHLTRISELGYAVDDEELDVGVKCVAAPIRDYTKRVIGAVSISAPSMRSADDRMDNVLIPLIRESAQELSDKLGYS